MKTIYRFWMIGLTSPLIYLVISLLVNRGFFARRVVAGFWPMSPALYEGLVIGLGAAALALLPIVYFLKTKWALRAPDTDDVEASLLESSRGRRFLALFMMCDTVALSGLILFLIQGRMTAVLLFGILGLVCYGLAFPGQPAHDEGD